MVIPALQEYVHSLRAIRYEMVSLDLKILLLLLIEIVAWQVSIVHPAENGSEKWRL